MSDPQKSIVPAGLDLSAAMSTAAQLGTAGVEVIERLHKIHAEQMKANARAAFFAAIADLHARMGSVHKNRVANIVTKSGARVSYRYADLHAVATALRKVTGLLGLSWRWSTEGDSGGVKVTCTASHRDGHSESSTWRAPIEGGNPLTSDAQKGKVATTFAQRVTLIQVFGLTDTEDDVDGAEVAPEPQFRPREEPNRDEPPREREPGSDDGEPVPPPVLASKEDIAAIKAMLAKAPVPAFEESRVLIWQKIADLTELPASRVREVKAAIEAAMRKGWVRK